MSNTCLVTTTIPYVNARPHVGFALELVQADAIARWHRFRGFDTFLLTGTDENAIKNVQAAREVGVPIREFCDRNAAVFRDLVDALNISADGFIRTSSPLHRVGAERFFRACESDDLYLDDYAGLYCVGCEDFYLEKDAVDGTCPVHGRPLEPVDERNWFFRLSRYGKQLEKLLVEETYRVTPGQRRNEALGLVRGGLFDFSISRSVERTHGWGIPVPDDPSQVLYVWFDALTNYLNGVGYADDPETFARRWRSADRIIHVCGKDVLKFHAVYWPAVLLSTNLRLPDVLHVHGHLTVDGRKISKSLGNAVEPFPVIDTFGADALRYYLLRVVPSDADSDFSHDRLREIYNADLANGLGNLVSRLETLAERARYRFRPSGDDGVADLVARLEPALSANRFHVALADLWTVVSDLNRDIESERPWERLRDGNAAALTVSLDRWITRLIAFAHGLSPFLPEAATEIINRFSSGVVRRCAPLFPRL